MTLALTEDELDWATSAVRDFPFDVQHLPDRWVKVAFEDFTAEQRARILYEVGVFNFLQARTAFTDGVKTGDAELEAIGNVLATLSASFLDAALKQK